MKTTPLLSAVAVLPLLAGLLCATVARAQVGDIEALDLDTYAMEISHTGVPGGLHGLILANDLAPWELVGTTMEEAPGDYIAHDPDAFYFSRRYYRVRSGIPASVFTWMDTYLVYPVEGLDNPPFAEADPVPRFEWILYPDPSATYQLDIYDVIPNGDGGWEVVPFPIFTVSGLVPGIDPTKMSYEFLDGDPPLQPSGTYAVVVSIEVLDGLLRGRPVLIQGHGTSLVDEGENIPVPPALAAPGAPGGGTDWKKAVKLLNELQAKKDEIQKLIDNNSLVQEKELYDALITILSDWDALKASVEQILNDQVDMLADQATLLNALCIIEKLIEIADKFDDNDKRTKGKAKLKQFGQQISNLKEAIEMGEKTFEQAKMELENIIALFSDPVEYLKEAVKERLFAKIKALLIRKFGEKAGGALFSVFLDLVNLTDLGINVLTLDGICTEYNRVLVEAINGDTSGPMSTERKYCARISETYNNCNVTISYTKMCWCAEPGGDPGEGTWQETPVRFSDDSTSMTATAGSLFDDFASGNRFKIKMEKQLKATDLTLPAGKGPCIVWADVNWECPAPLRSFSVRLRAGVIK